jgi:uncharacterized protein (DUF1330 family)
MASACVVRRATKLFRLLALLRRAHLIEQCLLSGVTRETFAQIEFKKSKDDENNFSKLIATKRAREVSTTRGGGKYVVRGGKTTSFQGTPPASRVVVLQFESMDKAQAWWDSPGRKNSQTIGDKYATFVFLQWKAQHRRPRCSVPKA